MSPGLPGPLIQDSLKAPPQGQQEEEEEKVLDCRIMVAVIRQSLQRGSAVLKVTWSSCATRSCTQVSELAEAQLDG